MIMFIDRELEMEKLMQVTDSERAELVLIYGRRRVGKSRLLTEFAGKVNALYLLADLSKNILEVLSKQIKDDFVRFSTWEDFFEFIYRSRHKIIIIDEFQYLYQIDKAWPSMLQRWWEKIKETNKKIILCGSVISTIYKISKGYGSALYGRKTYEIYLEPLKFKDIKGFLPDYGIEDLIKAYSILGGVPRYLEEFDSKLTVNENIRKNILDKTSFLYNEPMNLLFEEFRDPSPYVAIILSITQGYRKFNEISTMSKIQSNKLPKYLLILERIKLISKEVMVTERKIKTRNTRYKILDNFYKFWFRFVFGNRAYIEQGLEEEIFKTIEKNINAYYGESFEEICREFLIFSGIFQFTKIGRWWHKDKEIDIVALNEKSKEILFCECKWQENVNANKLINNLEKKAELVEWDSKKKYFAIFAKSFRKKVKDENLFLIDLKDLEGIIKKKNSSKQPL